MYGSKLRELRKSLGLQQTDISKQLGIPQATISYNERSEYPDLKHIADLCKLAGMDIWKFFISEEELSKFYNISKECLGLCLEIEKLHIEKKIKLLQLIKDNI